MKKYFILSITLMVCLTIWGRVAYLDYAMAGNAAIDTRSMLEDDLIYAEDSIMAEEIEDYQDPNRDTIYFEDFPTVGFIMWRYRAPGEAEAIVGSRCYEEQNYELAIKYCTKAAEMGNETGQFYLGLCYYEGNGVAQNYRTAVKWFKKAAKQGSHGGQFYLGLCYYKGEGVSQSYKHAAKWIKMAANDGYHKANEFLKEHAEELESVE